MNLQKAIDYLYSKGRPLDQRVYELHFGDGSIDTVLDALAAFQNEDGGFGNALEPDIRTPVSSAIATSTGFGIIRAIKASSDHPVVQQAVQYYLDTFDAEKKRWLIIPPEAEASPRAFWWAYAGVEESFSHFMHNPRAAVLGHLYAYADLVPADFLSELTEIQLTALEAPGYEPDMFDIDCYVGLANAPISDAVRERLNAIIEPAIRKLVTFEPDAELNEMSLVPLRIAGSPDAPFAHLFSDEMLAANLDRDLAGQLEDGSWEPGWNWSVLNAEAWEAAERDWKGHVIVHKLKMFEAFGRI